MSDSASLSMPMLFSVSLFDGIWMAYGGVANAEYIINIHSSKPLQINQMAVFLAGEIAEEIIIRDNVYYDYVRVQVDRNSALKIAYIGICLGLGSWHRDVVEAHCPRIEDMFYLSYQEWKEWISNLPGNHKQSLIQTASDWIEEAKLLARDVLIREFRVLEDMTNLILRESTLDTQDLEMFYQGLSQVTTPIPLMAEDDQQQALPLFDEKAFQINVLNRNLSLLPSSDFISSQDFENMNFQVQDVESVTIDILRVLRMIRATEKIRPYIRQAPMQYEVQSTYAHGISSLYIKECIQIIKDFYSHL